MRQSQFAHWIARLAMPLVLLTGLCPDLSAQSAQPYESDRRSPRRSSSTEALSTESSRASRAGRRARDIAPQDPLEAFRTMAPRQGSSGITSATPASRPAAPSVTRRTQESPSSMFARRATQGSAQGRGGAFVPTQPLNTMYLDPMQAAVEADEIFQTTLVYRSAKPGDVDHLLAVLKYDPGLVMPLGPVKNPIQEYLASPDDFSARVYAEEGIVVVEADVQNLPQGAAIEWARIEWLALAPTPDGAIAFITRGEPRTGAFAGDENILGDPAIGVAGVINAQYQIRLSEDAMEDLPLSEDLSLNTYATLYARGGKDVALRLVAPSGPVEAGDSFFVDLWLDNPSQSQFDALDVIIRYDPVVLSVRDYDEHNYIESGINIFDGAYHGSFPFDVHLENRAYPSSGQIRYTMGTHRSDYAFPSGKFASILFTALRPAAETEILFAAPDDSEKSGTRIEHLGIPISPGLVLGNAIVKVLP